MANNTTVFKRFFLITVIIITLPSLAFSQTLKNSVLHYFKLLESAPQEKLYLHIDKSFYAAGENIWFKGYLQDAITHSSVTTSNYIIVELTNRDNKVLLRKKIRREGDGFIGSIPLAANIPEGYYTLRGYSNWMLNAGPEFIYSRNIQVVNSIDVNKQAILEYKEKEGDSFLSCLADDYAVTFFPEGGELLDGVPQQVAFKVQGFDGLSKELQGRVYTDRGDTVAYLRTEHDGMGVFSLLPSANEVYYADLFTVSGVRKQVALPEVKKVGVGISVARTRQGILYTVQHTPATDFPEGLSLVVHTRGAVKLFRTITSESLKGILPTDFFDDGISHFLLINEEGVAVSERLFFSWAPQSVWSITPDKEEYGQREKVTVTIEAKRNTGEPIDGTFSVSITDAGLIPVDSLCNHIQSNLLLTSDLKGYIENPGYYFFGDRKIKDRHLDLLMLTHGWRRFTMDKLTGKPQLNMEHYIEVSQSISGRVRGLTGKAKNAPVSAFSLKGLIHQTAMTNENGEFVIADINFPEKTRLFVQARTARGGGNLEVTVDSLAFAPPYNKEPFPNILPQVKSDFLINTRKSYFADGGEQVYHLHEVTITGKRKKQNENSFYDSMSKEVITEDDIADAGYVDIYDLLLRIPGIERDENTILYRQNKPILVVDNIIYDQEDGVSVLDDFYLNDIEQVNLLTNVQATNMFGAQGSYGAILFELKRGINQQSRMKPKGALWIMPLGYSTYTEFYHPVYDTPEKKNNPKPDLRTTIYWNPALTLDTEGKAIIEYYTPDRKAPQHIIIEGVAADGSVLRGTR
ncbi:TonB-dependent receptor [Bacteroides sp. 214]|uniref:Plug and carboxypeptidase regulatory-like domain-containing protein n=1 Tax=Bacteroides sp. 214 TaxID=2302935 RepID=UPI0013D502E2|nr:Plug and carboxypeptidase regulatory-like domain-containing protein [Bacteroides sp. 214]NDW12044.1 TonB-dependent receptor [Bacteroides sp. 214]